MKNAQNVHIKYKIRKEGCFDEMVLEEGGLCLKIQGAKLYVCACCCFTAANSRIKEPPNAQ